MTILDFMCEHPIAATFMVLVVALTVSDIFHSIFTLRKK